jgi:heme oxygenase (biliverdin-IX-beta and delta-forming)
VTQLRTDADPALRGPPATTRRPAPSGAGATAAHAPGGTFLARLRAETRDLHEATERHLAPGGRRWTLPAYRRLLICLHPMYAAVETRLESFSEWATLSPMIELRPLRRAEILAGDLRLLGVDAPHDLAERVAPLDLPSFDQALGALYVLEGSRLGGRILAREVAASIGPAVEDAVRFLRSDGVAVGPVWMALRASLGCYADGAGPGARAAIVEGARETFRCFDRQLATWGP